MAIALDDCRRIVVEAVSECTDSEMLYLVWTLILSTFEDGAADNDDAEDEEDEEDDFDMMPDILNRHKFYKSAIAEAVEECTDIDLLDLVWKLLIHESGSTNNA